MKVMILAGGMGSRLSEETTLRPKPMVEIGGRPIIWHIMNVYGKQGFNEFIVACGYKAEIIKAYFLNFYAINNDVTIDLSSGKTTIYDGQQPNWRVHLVDTGIKTEKFTEIARLVADLSGVTQPANRPVTGDMLYNVESGIIATWVKNVGDDLLEPFPYRPELVGQADPTIVMGKGSGLDSVAIWLGRHGINDAETKEIEIILAEVKGRSLAKKGLLDDDEFLDVVREVIPDKVN